MPPKRKIGKNAKVKQHKARAEAAMTAWHHGRAAHQFPTIMSLLRGHSDAQYAEEAKGDSAHGIIIYINVN
jgi:hypothetical protein